MLDFGGNAFGRTLFDRRLVALFDDFRLVFDDLELLRPESDLCRDKAPVDPFLPLHPPSDKLDSDEFRVDLPPVVLVSE